MTTQIQHTTDEPSTVLSQVIPLDWGGARLDQAVARLFSDYSRERLKDWINQGHLLVEGKVWRPKDRVVGGETVTLEIMLEVETEAKPQDIPLNIVYEDDGLEIPLDPRTRVSMNFWGFTPKVFEQSAALFKQFALANTDNPKAEFFITLVSDMLIKNKQATFKVIPTQNQWFGVTYKEDKPLVQENINSLIKGGVYPQSLWEVKHTNIVS